MKKYLILIAGSPATGKSYLIHEIKKVIPDIFMIAPDEVKEMLADSVGFNSLAEKSELEKRVWKFYYDVLELYMSVGKRIILSEYPFSYKQKSNLENLSKQYDYEVITIRLIADFDILWERRQLRDVEETRHLSHIMTYYHFGDRLENRKFADNLITKKDFQEIIKIRKYNEFQIGKLYEIDVSDYSTVDYTGLINELSGKVQSNE